MARNSLKKIVFIFMVGCSSYNYDSVYTYNRYIECDDLDNHPRHGVNDRVVDAGNDANNVITTVDASTDGGLVDAALTCKTIVGHCVSHMGTLCTEYDYDNSTNCSGDFVTGWFAGKCNDDVNITFSSLGGCKDTCGAMEWQYPIGGAAGNELAKSAVADFCKLIGKEYVSP